MIFTCLLVAHCVGAYQESKTEIPVLHSRPSKVLAALKPLEPTDPGRLVKLTADDSRGVIVAKGSSAGISDIQNYVRLFDVARAQVGIDLQIESAVDKISYQVSAKILNNQQWKTSDGDTGIAISITPRINDDGSVSLFVAYSKSGERTVTCVIRVKNGSSTSLWIPDDNGQLLVVTEDGKAKKETTHGTGSKITIRTMR